MVLGAVSWNHKSDLMVIDGNLNTQRCINEILRPHVVNLLGQSYDVSAQQ